MDKKLFTASIVAGTMLLTACGSTTTEAPNTNTEVTKSSDDVALVDGNYSGVANGHNGEITVSVEVKDGKIASADVVETNETHGIGDKATALVLSEIVQSGTTQVDAVSYATISSNATKTAVQDALKKAGADDAYFKNEEKANIQRSNYADSYDYDVVIIGAGGAGLSAALEAREAGATVAVIEKTAFTGGNTLVSGGGLNAPGTKIQLERGIEDSVEQFYEDTYNSGDKEANPELVHVLAENALDAVDWLVDDMHVEFMPDRLQQFGGHSVPRALIPVGNHGDELINKLEAKANELGVDFFFYVEGEQITKDENGRVNGVVGRCNEQEITFHANKGVILATGGFASNVEMRKEANANYDERFKTTARNVSDGSGILMAEEVGAGVTDMEFIQVYPTCNPLTGIISYVANSRMDGGILVNQNGDRFINEMGRRDVISNAILDQEGEYAYLLWGNEIESVGHMTEVHSVEYQQWKDMGLLYVCDTIEEAAEKVGINPDHLKTTVDSYNASIEDGADEDFNRTGTLRSVNEGPFYIQKVVPSSHHTMGGVVINTNAQVLSASGDVIDGLYAAGEVTGDIHGTNRLGGNAITDCVVFGRIAGQNVVK